MELMLLGLLAVVIFGPAKLPEIGRSISAARHASSRTRSAAPAWGTRLSGVNDVRSAMTPTNLAKAAMPASVKQVTADVTDMKQTLQDPLGMKKGRPRRGEARAPSPHPRPRRPRPWRLSR